MEAPIESGAVNSGVSSLRGYLSDKVTKPIRVIEPAVSYSKVITSNRDIVGSNKVETERVITPPPEYVPIVQTYVPAPVTNENRDTVKIEPAVNYNTVNDDTVITRPSEDTPKAEEFFVNEANKYKAPEPEPEPYKAPEPEQPKTVIEPAKTFVSEDKKPPIGAAIMGVLGAIPIFGAIFGGGSGNVQRKIIIEPAKGAKVGTTQSNTGNIMVTLLILGIAYFVIKKYKK